MRSISTRLCLLALILIISPAAFAQDNKNDSTAEQIVQRAIDNNGGDAKLDTLTSLDIVTQLIAPNGDTSTLTVKKKDQNEYSISSLDLKHEGITTIYNKGKAVRIKNDTVHVITDPYELESMQLQCYVSMDYAYKKLGYKLTRGYDQVLDSIDCYVVMAVSPLGQTLQNCYDKKTGDLLLVIYPDGSKTVFAQYATNDQGIIYPSKMFVADSSNNLSESDATSIIFSEQLDSNWFQLPAKGSYIIPSKFREGSFVYASGFAAGSKISRTKDEQIEAGDGKTNFYLKVKWISDSEYWLYYDHALNSGPSQAGVEVIRIRILSWKGNTYYCQYVTNNSIGGTCSIAKLN